MSQNKIKYKRDRLLSLGYELGWYLIRSHGKTFGFTEQIHVHRYSDVTNQIHFLMNCISCASSLCISSFFHIHVGVLLFIIIKTLEFSLIINNSHFSIPPPPPLQSHTLHVILTYQFVSYTPTPTQPQSHTLILAVSICFTVVESIINYVDDIYECWRIKWWNYFHLAYYILYIWEKLGSPCV